MRVSLLTTIVPFALALTNCSQTQPTEKSGLASSADGGSKLVCAPGIDESNPCMVPPTEPDPNVIATVGTGAAEATRHLGDLTIESRELVFPIEHYFGPESYAWMEVRERPEGELGVDYRESRWPDIFYVRTEFEPENYRRMHLRLCDFSPGYRKLPRAFVQLSVPRSDLNMAAYHTAELELQAETSDNGRTVDFSGTLFGKPIKFTVAYDTSSPSLWAEGFEQISKATYDTGANVQLAEPFSIEGRNRIRCTNPSAPKELEPADYEIYSNG